MSANAELQSSQLPKSKNPDLIAPPVELSCSFSPILWLGWLSLMHHHLLIYKWGGPLFILQVVFFTSLRSGGPTSSIFFLTGTFFKTVGTAEYQET